MRVAICDDENNWVNQIDAHLTKFKERHKDIEWDVFYSGEQLLKYYSEYGSVFDVLILDIELDGLSGIETALKIRDYDKNAVIFFLTSHTKYVYDCFKPMPANFWVKPVEYEKFSKDMDEVAARLSVENPVFLFKGKGEYVRIKYNDIIYCSKDAKKIVIHTDSDDYETYSSMREIETQLKPYGFSSPHKSYCVNMNRIEHLKPNEIILSNGESIPVSKSRKQEFKKEFLDFARSELL